MLIVQLLNATCPGERDVSTLKTFRGGGCNLHLKSCYVFCVNIKQVNIRVFLFKNDETPNVSIYSVSVR